jgi:hypothetical protein
VAVSAQVSDALSGIVAASCNGAPASVSAGQVECSVALQPGMNTVVVSARDAAGNGASSGVTVQRTGTASALRIVPGSRTLLVGESESLSAVDDYGVLVQSATWISSDLAVLTVDSTGKATAIAAGEVTVTAAAQSLVAEVTVTVLAGTSLPQGTVRWEMAPTPGLTMDAPIYLHQVDATVPSLLTVEYDSSYTATVRALTASGDSLWTAIAPGWPVYGDSFGGVVAEIRDEYWQPRGLVRFGGPSGVTPWRYDSPGQITAGAQAPDGTIYTTELLPGTSAQGTAIWDRFIVVIDGVNGQVRRRIPLPRNVNTYPHCPSPTGYTTLESLPVGSEPIVGTDGNGYFQVRQEWRHLQGTCLQNGSNAPIYKDVQNTLTLMRIEPTGAVTSQTLYQFQYSGPGINACEWMPRPRKTMPDSTGSILATWDRYQPGTCPLFEMTATRFDANGARADHLLSTSEAQQPEILMTGDSGTVFLSGSGGYPTAVDAATWTTKWAAPVAGEAAMALGGGGMAIYQSWTGTMAAIDRNGNVAATTPMPVLNPVSALLFGEWLGIDPTTGALRAIWDIPQSDPPAPIEPAVFSYKGARGNVQGQAAPKDIPPTGIFVKGHYIGAVKMHLSIRITPKDQNKWRNDPLWGTAFDNVDDRGNYFATIGAGSNLDTCSGLLLSNLNRPRDVKQPARHLSLLLYPAAIEDQLIDTLLNKDVNYPDDLTYTCWTELLAGYNSNSYAVGLLNAADLPQPQFLRVRWGQYPGSLEPVPVEVFAGQQP